MSDNMYTPPETVASATSTQNGGAVTAEAKEALAKTAFWYKFFGILGFIMCGFMVLAGIIVMIAMPAAGAVAKQSGFDSMMAGMGAFLGIFYIIMAVVMFFPVRNLYRAGKAGKNYQFTDSPDDLTASLEYTRKYWKFIGVFANCCRMICFGLKTLMPVRRSELFLGNLENEM